MVTVVNVDDLPGDSDIPKLSEIENKLKEMEAREPLHVILSLRQYFGEIASGEAPPVIRNETAQFASQAMCILMNHVWGSWKEQVKRHGQAS
jgi:hypothetical protein